MNYKKLRKRREDGLNNLAKVIEKLYGPRCSRTEPVCVSCMAWIIFDQMEKITDSSYLDMED